MRAWRRGAGILALAALLTPAAARADELLVMPYACTMAGGQPVLTPGPEQSHRIIGARDQRKHNACSQVNQGMCQQWTVHRFDLDCDGQRVSWVSVVAATNEGSRRAWLLDGRLVLRMAPWWSLPPDDPCAREPDPDDRANFRRMKRYCAEQRAQAPPAVVEMPFGYAPMLGINGIFVKTAPGVAGAPPLPPVAAAPPPGKSAANEPLQELFPPTPTPALRAEPPREAGVGEAPVAKSAPQVPPQTAPQPQPPPKAAAAPTAVPPPAPPIPETPRPAPNEAKPVPSGPNLGPRLVTPSPPPPKPAAAPTGTPGTATTEAMPTGAADRVAGSSSSPPKQSEAPQRDPVPGTGSSAPGFSLLSVFRATTTGAIVAFAGLALGLLIAFALARRREHAQDARRRPRDLAAVSLDGKRGKLPARIGKAPPAAAGSAASRIPAQASAPSPLEAWGDSMPRTRTEALQVLGMGVAPSATEVMLKKIVDGLRQSWHPDLAKDDADRAVRELRSKQINVAWDLLRGQRAEV